MDGSARIVDMLQVFHIRSGALNKRAVLFTNFPLKMSKVQSMG